MTIQTEIIQCVCLLNSANSDGDSSLMLRDTFSISIDRRLEFRFGVQSRNRITFIWINSDGYTEHQGSEADSYIS